VILQSYLSDWFDKNIASRGQSRLCRSTVRKGFAFPISALLFTGEAAPRQFEA